MKTLNSTSKLSEDLGAAPIWVFNNGISHNDEVDTAAIAPFVKVCSELSILFSVRSDAP
jgi:hypothetical protein